MTDPLVSYATRITPQSEQIPGRTDQVENSAGGHSFIVDDWGRLQRFLILGSGGGTYYIGERELTKQNADALLRCLNADATRTVATIVDISTSGRAAKQNPTIFALAAAAGHPKAKDHALAALPKVCRTGTHLLMFAGYVEQFRGWGRGLRRAVADWYQAKPIDDLAYQAIKYKQRGGWSQRDLLRLAHPATTDAERNRLYRWIAGKNDDATPLPPLVVAHESAMATKSLAEMLTLLHDHPSLPWEALPAEMLGRAAVWDALLPNLPMGALIRNLGRMSANGCLTPMSDAARVVTRRLGDEEAIRKARIHPIAVLSALATYQQGHGARGGLTWSPVAQVVDALDAAFYAAFGNVVPSGKRTMLALDVSSSMSLGEIAGVPGITPRVGSAAMAMVTARTESDWIALGFSDRLIDLPISPRQRLEDVVNSISGIPFGGTDCALPILAALKNKIPVDTFIVYTDSETWAGQIHPTQALERYRQTTGIDARSVVVGMTSNGFTIADPCDAGQLDVVGFDTAAPDVISAFSRGEI